MYKKILAIILSLIMVLTMVPVVAFAETIEMSDEFKSILNEDNKLELDCAPPKDLDEAYILIAEYLAVELGWEYEVSSFNADFTTVVINYYGDGRENNFTESHTVPIQYNYDARINNVIDSLSKDISQSYTVTDLELVNYFINKGNKDGLVYYSGDFRECFGYNNISFDISERAGDDLPLLIYREGVGTVTYDGTAYAAFQPIKAVGEYIVYVPDGTEDTPKAYAEAAQKRIDAYLGQEGLVKISHSGKVHDIWCQELYRLYYHETYEQTYDEWYDEYIRPYEDVMLNDTVATLGVSTTTDVYLFEANGAKSYFLILEDSSKMLNPEYIGKNLELNVEISTENGTVPLDTVVGAEEVTNGDDYDRIKDVIDAEDSKMYNLTLYSNSLGDNVKKIENGKFIVKLPLPSNMNGKKLVVFYVSEDNKVTKHEVTVKDGYAVFETDHFSIYTLAAIDDDNTTGGTTTTDKTTPVTGDNTNLVPWLLAFVASCGIGVVTYRKRKEQ